MLERIAAAKRREIEELKISMDISEVKPRDVIDPRPFLCRTDGNIAVIAEVKKASPVKGVLCADFEPVSLAKSYQRNGAGAVSVITDQDFFQGDRDYLTQVKSAVDLPVLRKDFILDAVQLYESVLLGADIILLIAAMHDYASLLSLSEKADQLGLYILLEVHDRDELHISRDLPVQLVGINNRNLKDFTISLVNSLQLVDDMPEGVVRVSESGIRDHTDLRNLQNAGFHAALIGEALVSAPDPGLKLRQILYATGRCQE
ncbi:MAG: indole-3-glycerol phosphate synthase TrpC [Deltaproteobacteria bacterium]